MEKLTFISWLFCVCFNLAYLMHNISILLPTKYTQRESLTDMICFNNNSKNYDFHIERKMKINFCFIAGGTENTIYIPIYKSSLHYCFIATCKQISKFHLIFHIPNMNHIQSNHNFNSATRVKKNHIIVIKKMYIVIFFIHIYSGF